MHPGREAGTVVWRFLLVKEQNVSTLINNNNNNSNDDNKIKSYFRL